MLVTAGDDFSADCVGCDEVLLLLAVGAVVTFGFVSVELLRAFVM